MCNKGLVLNTDHNVGEAVIVIATKCDELGRVSSTARELDSRGFLGETRALSSRKLGQKRGSASHKHASQTCLVFSAPFRLHLEHFSLAISVPPTGVFASCGQSWLSSRQ